MKSTRAGRTPEPSRAPGSAKVRSILVVDDEARIADTLALILESKGYAAKAAYDAASGMALCDEFRPDLVISDVVMPGMNGIEMAIIIRRQFPACRILLFSGQAATADMLEQARARGHEFELIAKPVHPEQLLERVKQVLDVADAHSAVRARAE